MAKSQSFGIVPLERIAAQIYVIRGEKVMLDFELAELYGVETRTLNQAVSRNGERFPDDFCFRLSVDEVNELNRSQIVTGSQKHRDPRYPPRAFTEQGVAMLSSVLRSKRAAEVNVLIMRTYVQLRNALMSNEELARIVAEHGQIITDLCAQVDWLLAAPESEERDPIGFRHPRSQ